MRAAAQTSSRVSPSRPNNFTSLNTGNNNSVRVHRSGSISISASPLNVKSGDDTWRRPNQQNVPMSPSLLDLASGPLY
jgi:hypothetical protein